MTRKTYDRQTLLFMGLTMFGALMLVIAATVVGPTLAQDAQAQTNTTVPEENHFTPTSQTTIIRERSYATKFTVRLPEDDVEQLQVRFYKLHENRSTLQYVAFAGENQKIYVGLDHGYEYRIEVESSGLNETKTVTQFIPKQTDTEVTLVFR